MPGLRYSRLKRLGHNGILSPETEDETDMSRSRYDSEYEELLKREEEDDYPWLDCPQITPWDEEPSAVSPEPPRPPESKYPLYIQMAIKRLEYGTEEERLDVLQRYDQVRAYRDFVSLRPHRKRDKSK